MKYYITLLFLINIFYGYGQSEVNIYTERQGEEVIIFADNPSFIPMTADIKLDLTNMRTDFGGKKGMFVIPPKSEKHQVASAKSIRKTGRTGMSLESIIYLGDVRSEHDDDYTYELSFASGETYIISQGYNGRFSHQGENALDFSMDVGDKVYAARGGVVYKIVEKNSKSCQHSSCQQYNNHITVYHSDGTFSEYSHLSYKGAEVEIGDKIEAGDFIGYSGNTGWSSGPHLHFVVYKFNEKGRRETIKTKFKTSEKERIYLKENESYTRS